MTSLWVREERERSSMLEWRQTTDKKAPSRNSVYIEVVLQWIDGDS